MGLRMTYPTLSCCHIDVPLDIVDVDASIIVRHLEHLVWHLDEPLADQLLLMFYLLVSLLVLMA